MAFVKKPGFKGMIYVPDNEIHKNKKHNCSDCYSCQNCSDSRCELCLKQKKCNSKKNKPEN